MLDLLIKNADILDGTGAPAFVGDVAVKNGKIVTVGRVNEEAARVIDGTGLVLSPGFIDSHSHSDRTWLIQPDQREKLEQGITFSIAGQCGSSVAPKTKEGKELSIEALFSQVEKSGLGSGGAMLVGHGTLRCAVMGTEKRAATKAELENMKALLRECMQAGALGLSYGLIYAPSCYSTTEEVMELAKTAAECGGMLASHIRNEGDQLLEAVQEYLDAIQFAGCRAVFSHHKSAGKWNWGRVKESMAMVDRANANGADIYFDVYPYVASSNMLPAAMIPKQFHPEGTKNALDLLDKPKVVANIKEWFYGRYGNDLSHIMIGEYKLEPELCGKRISEIAEMRGVTEQIEVAFDLIRASRGNVRGIYFTMCEEDVEYVMKHPRTMIGTDSATKGDNIAYHPRLRGSFPRALGRYVRERGVVTLPEMIRKMTSLPAHVYGLSGKGKIAVGMDADLCLFDPKTIADGSDFKDFSRQNEGLRAVIVNGKVAVENNVANGVCATTVYRRRLPL